MMIELDMHNTIFHGLCLNRIRWDGAKIKSLSSVLAKKLHMSSSAIVTFVYLTFCL